MQCKELPLVYGPKSYDLAGFALGIAEREHILPKTSSIQPNDIVIALPSSGVHSNGFSLVHKIMDVAGVTLETKTSFGKSFGTSHIEYIRQFIH